MDRTVWAAIAGVLMLVWLGLAVVGPRKVDGANIIVLRYGGVWRLLALVFALAPAFVMLYAMWVVPTGKPSTQNIAGALLVTVSVIGGLLLVEVTRVQIVVTEDGLTRHSPWAGTGSLRWIDVEVVRYSAGNRYFTVSGGGQTIRVSRSLSGLSIFAETLRRKVAEERRTAAATALEAVK
jgi:hypothetical protein